MKAGTAAASAARRAARWSGQYVDYRLATLVSLGLGATVFVININHGVGLASVAAIKQAVYSFCLAGVVARGCERIATSVPGRARAILLAGLVPSALTILFTYAVHTMKGTPEPLLSTLPTVLSAPMANFYWGWHHRRKLEASREGLHQGVAGTTQIRTAADS